MSRTNRRHNRQVERHRRNKGPELLSQAADNELQQKADQMADSLSKAIIDRADLAAASLLITLAEGARQNENSAAFEEAFSIAEKWAREPEVSPADAAAQLGGTVTRLALTDGKPNGDKEEAEIIDAEWEMVPETPGG
jgi:hypothetical protein